MAKKKNKNGQEAMRDAYKKMIKNRKFDNPFDAQKTDDARGKSIDELIKELEKDVRREQFFKNPKYPRA